MKCISLESEFPSHPYLENLKIENNHDDAGDVEGAEGGIDDELWVVKPTEVVFSFSQVYQKESS